MNSTSVDCWARATRSTAGAIMAPMSQSFSSSAAAEGATDRRADAEPPASRRLSSASFASG
eukprot:12368089-Alexandrium_andersonii.AAC.1